MSSWVPRVLLFLLMSAVLTGCAAPRGGKLQSAGQADVFGMRLDTSLEWARLSQGARAELWTIDGPLLNQLRVFAPIKPDEHVFLRGRKTKADPNGPWFRVDMRPDEVRNVVIDALREQGWADVSARGLRPARFGEYPGLRFDLDLVNQNGLIYKGTVASATVEQQLRLLVWLAPAEHYHPRDVAAVNTMLNGLRFVP